MKKSTRFILLCLIILPVFTWALAIITTKRKYTVFPVKRPYSDVSVNCDNEWGGNSSIDSFSGDKDSIDLMYTLRYNPHLQNSMATISIDLDRINGNMDLSGFSAVTVQMKKASREKVVVSLKSFLPGVSTQKPGSYRHNISNLTISPAKEDYVLPLKQFRTAKWWVTQWVGPEIELPPDEFKQANRLEFLIINTTLSEGGEERGIMSIGKIELIPKYSSHIRIFTIGLLFWYTGLGAICFLNRKPRRSRIIPQGKSIERNSYRNQDLERIMEYLKTNYTDPHISTETLYESLGISIKRTRQLLKEYFNLTFTQLINKIRIKEAKRCLMESDLRIFDIAVEVGFNNNSYFNKIFKQSEGVTPSDYRKHKKNKKDMAYTVSVSEEGL